MTKNGKRKTKNALLVFISFVGVHFFAPPVGFVLNSQITQQQNVKRKTKNETKKDEKTPARPKSDGWQYVLFCATTTARLNDQEMFEDT